MASGRGASDKDRTRVTNNKRGDGDRPFRYRPNPARQAIFVVLALIGIGAGYGIGYLVDGQNSSSPEQKPVAAIAEDTRPTQPNANATKAGNPASANAFVAPPLLPENGKAVQGSPVRAYEEALPKDIVEAHPPAAPLTAPPPVAETPKPAQPAVEARSAPAEQVAALPPRPDKALPAAKPPAAVGNLPTWRKFAVAVTAADGRPRIAIVIDDLGVDKARTARAITLRPPLTLSFLTYASGLKELTAAASAAGHELMMHIPMEPGSADVDPGPNVLLTGIPRDELLASLRWNLQQFDRYVGINNHMGSRFTADLPGMLVVMDELRKRDLLFLDSVTAGNSAAGKAARRAGVPFTRRNIFLDHDDNVTSIKKQLAEVEKLAQRTGHAVAIGHPREATLQALIPWLDEVEGRGFQLVPVSAMIRPPAPRG